MGFGAELGRVHIEVRAKMDKLKSDFDKATKGVDDQMRGLGGKMAKTGDTLNKTLTPAMAAFAGVGKLVDDAYGDGFDTIIAKTGATGERLKSLEGSMKNVATSGIASFERVGSVIGTLNQMLGLTGKPLEDLTRQITQLDRLGQSIDPQLFARFMGDWSISAEEAGGSLDRLYKISQNTGMGVEQLLGLVVQFGAPMRSLGFSVEDSTLMLAKWHKEGVNVETLLQGMKMGLGKIAKGMGGSAEATLAAEKAQDKYNEAVEEFGADSTEAEVAMAKLEAATEKVAASAGTSIPKEFQKTIDAIKNAGSESEAFEIAISRFGLRAGPDFARAVMEGRFNLDELKASTENSTGAINDSYKATLGLAEKFELWKNKIIGVLGPLGEYGMMIGGIGMAIGPVMSLGGRLIQHFTKAGLAAGASAAPIAASGAASATAGTMAAAGSTGFWAMAAGVWATLAPILAVIAIIAVLIGIGYLLIKNWDTVKNALGATWNWLKEHWRGVVHAILSIVLGPLGYAIGLIINNWDKVKEGARKALDWVTDKWDKFTHWLTNIPNRLGNWGSRMWNGMVDGFKAAWNAVARLINRLPSFNLPGIFGGGRVGFPQLPELAEGGRIAQSGLAVVGERGKENVWLPAGAEVDKRSRGRGPGGGGATVIQYIQGSVVTERQLAGMARGGLSNVSRYNGSVGFE